MRERLAQITLDKKREKRKEKRRKEKMKAK